MNATDARPSRPTAGRFWLAAMALCALSSAGFAGFWLSVAVAHEHSLLRDPAVIGGVMLLLAGAVYGAIEVTRRWRRRPSRISLPLGVFFTVVVFLSGGLLIVRGLQERKRSADTRMIEELRVVGGESGK